MGSPPRRDRITTSDSRSATEDSERPPFVILTWQRHEPKVTAVLLLLIAGLIVGMPLGLYILQGSIVMVIALIVGVAGAILLLFVTLSNRGWAGAFSLRVTLDAGQARFSIERALTDGGYEWKDAIVAEPLPYYRQFSRPIEVLRPAARIWTHSESWQEKGTGPMHHLTIVVIQPLNPNEVTEPLQSGLLASFRHEGERVWGQGTWRVW